MTSVSDMVTYKVPLYAANPRLRNVLITHRTYLREHKDTVRRAVDKNKARPFYYNLYGYLLTIDIPSQLHWIICMLSDMNSPEDFDGSVDMLYIPDIGIIDEIMSVAKL